MSSTLQFELISLQQNNYITLVILTAVSYDYFLTLFKEVEYIWSKPWTWVSTLFVLVRYCGLYNLIILTLCEITFIINAWAFVLFFGAADFVMILRVWAMYNRSRIIIIFLLALFAAEMISTILSAVSFSNPKNESLLVIQIGEFSVCESESQSPIWTQVATILQVTHGAAVCTLAIIQFMRQSLQMYRSTNRWQLNRYMNLLVKEGIVYFFAIVLFNVINLLGVSGKLPTEGWRVAVFGVLEYVPVYTLTPRFIMSMRELYARDVRGVRAEGVDTAFGLASGGVVTGESMVFADLEQNEIEEVPREVTEVETSAQPS